jgi:hypothetical protein
LWPIAVLRQFSSVPVQELGHIGGVNRISCAHQDSTRVWHKGISNCGKQ